MFVLGVESNEQILRGVRCMNKVVEHVAYWWPLYFTFGLIAIVFGYVIIAMYIGETTAVFEDLPVVGKTFISDTEKCVLDYHGKRVIPSDSGCKYSIGEIVNVKIILGDNFRIQENL